MSHTRNKNNAFRSETDNTLLKKGPVDVPNALPAGVEPRRLRAAWTVLVNQVQDRAHYNNGCCHAGPRLQAKLARLKIYVYTRAKIDRW